jgi:hypothetical protein
LTALVAEARQLARVLDQPSDAPDHRTGGNTAGDAALPAKDKKR